MDNLKDKVIGSWYGMAVGDAIGVSAKNMKPETVRQFFGSMDSFKDVRPLIGKGVKKSVLAFEINTIKMVGHYAIRIYWKDNHNSGIYPFELLQKLGNDSKN